MRPFVVLSQSKHCDLTCLDPVLPGLGDNLSGYADMKDFVMSLEKPRCAQYLDVMYERLKTDRE